VWLHRQGQAKIGNRTKLPANWPATFSRENMNLRRKIELAANWPLRNPEGVWQDHRANST
jgi:hypothetical protein